MKNEKKYKYKLFLIVYSYLTILILFGVIYWLMCNYSNGECFIFQEDINMKYNINYIKKSLKLNYKSKNLNKFIEDIFTKDEFKRPIVKVDDGDKEDILFSYDKELGIYWSKLYCEIINMKGISHFKINYISDEEVLNKYDTKKIELVFYRSLKGLKEDDYKIIDSDSRGLTYVYKQRLYVTDKGYINSLTKDKKRIYPVQLFLFNIINASINYLDNIPVLFKKAYEGKYTYPLTDFIYFSAVTITTLGYGDILPNSENVRILVMVETLLGVFLASYFAATILPYKNK